MRQAGISLAATPLAKIPLHTKPARELAALPQNVSCSDPLPPATQATKYKPYFVFLFLKVFECLMNNKNQNFTFLSQFPPFQSFCFPSFPQKSRKNYNKQYPNIFQLKLITLTVLFHKIFIYRLLSLVLLIFEHFKSYK